MNRVNAALVLLANCAFVSVSANATMIDLVPVGNTGNAFQPITLAGAVSYDYSIGRYEVTNSQYVEFLNAKAKSDPLGLYNFGMGADVRGGITQTGASGGLAYSVKSNMGDKPVNYVGFWDAIRFVNWLSNGAGTGDTETGRYTLLGGTPTPTNADSVSRNPGTTWVLPSLDEWYKAAYYDPRITAQGGPPADSHYWLYPTQSSAAPVMATANSIGNISNPGLNVANYSEGADWNGKNGNVTTVGSAGPLSASFYGTFDQGGNVHEWNEKLYLPSERGVQGGNWQDDKSALQSLSLGERPTTSIDGNWLGFRVGFATVAVPVPEPSSLLLGALGLIGLVALHTCKR